MPRKITEQSFFKYIKCPSWVYFDAIREQAPHDPLLLRLMDDGLLPESEREVLRDRADVAEVTVEDEEEAFLQTLGFMREGRGTIYHAVLIDGPYVAHPDILEKVEGRSRFGNFYYVAADIKRARSLRDEYQFQGCFYAELLKRIQETKPMQGYVLTPDKTVLRYAIEEFERTYKLTLDDIERIVAGEKPPHFLTSSCKQSPWFSACQQEAAVCNDVSVLNRVWREEVAALEAAGIKTINELAKWNEAELVSRVSGVREPRLKGLRQQAIAIRDQKHIILQRVDLPESKVELYFDIESDPLRDLDYLFGVLVVDQGKSAYYSFFAENEEALPQMWRDFCACIESHMDAPIYHYGWYETEVLQRFMAKFGISEIAREALERNMIDLLHVIRPAIVFPLSFYSLKDLAHYIGFEWRTADASGANSVLWFEEWLKSGKAGSPPDRRAGGLQAGKPKRLLKKIFEYNEDDVRATHALKRFVWEQAGPYSS